MSGQDRLAEQFETSRHHLQAVAYRMLGSFGEAEDAVQECWLRLSRSDASGIDNVGGWLTTTVSRICLDMLRSRKSRREESIDEQMPEAIAGHGERSDPEREALLAEAVGIALLVVLDTLNPAERVAFVLHDIFAMPFDDIAAIVGKSEAAARKLASRARRRVRGSASAGAPNPDLARQRELVDAFLAAAYDGDFDKLVASLDPDVVVRDDRQPSVIRGARTLAAQLSGRAQAARSVLVNGAIGAAAAPRGKLLYVLQFTIRDGKIAEIDLVSAPSRIRRLELALLDER